MIYLSVLSSKNYSLANQGPFVSPKEFVPVTDAQVRHSGMKDLPVNDKDGLPIGQQSSRLNTLLPNIMRGGGGSLKFGSSPPTTDMGLTLIGVEQFNNVPKYRDAIQSIEDVIDRARANLANIKQQIREEDNGIELPIPEAEIEETQMNEAPELKLPEITSPKGQTL